MVRDTAPGEYLRLALYDLQEIVAGLTGPRPAAPGRGHDEVRRAGIAVLAADLQAAPGAVPALQRWLDPDSTRTLQAVLADPANPLRSLWPRDGRLPDALRTDDADALVALLATTYTLGLTWSRLAQVPPPATGFAVPQAVAAELTSPAMHSPPSTDELSAWDIIKAARAHMAAERADQPVAPVPEPAQDAPGPPPRWRPPLPRPPPNRPHHLLPPRRPWVRPGTSSPPRRPSCHRRPFRHRRLRRTRRPTRSPRTRGRRGSRPRPHRRCPHLRRSRCGRRTRRPPTRPRKQRPRSRRTTRRPRRSRSG